MAARPNQISHDIHGALDEALNWYYAVKTCVSHLVVFLAKREITAADRGQLAFYREMMQKDLVDGPRS